MKQIHYSWLVCLSCTLLLICTMGFCNNVFPVFLPYLEAEMLTGTQGSALISIRCFFGILGMFIVERFYRWFSIRIGLTITCVITAAAFAIYAVADVPWMFNVGAAVSGLGYGLGSMIPVAILIRSWFNQRQSTAIGLCSAGSGISTVLFPPLVTQIVENAGISAGLWLLSGFTLLVGGVVFAVVRDRPSQKGIQLYGAQRPTGKTTETAPRKPNNASSAAAYIAQFGCLFIGAVAASGTGHFSAHFSAQGYPSAMVSLGISIFGASLTISKLVCGTQFDRRGGEKTGVRFLLFALTGCILCCFAEGANLFLMYASLILMGIGFSVATVGVPTWAAEFSSESNYRKVLRRFQITYAIGSTVFSVVPGMIYDRTGNYRGAYVMMALQILTMLILLRIAYYQRNHRGII